MEYNRKMEGNATFCPRQVSTCFQDKIGKKKYACTIDEMEKRARKMWLNRTRKSEI